MNRWWNETSEIQKRQLKHHSVQSVPSCTVHRQNGVKRQFCMSFEYRLLGFCCWLSVNVDGRSALFYIVFIAQYSCFGCFVCQLLIVVGFWLSCDGTVPEPSKHFHHGFLPERSVLAHGTTFLLELSVCQTFYPSCLCMLMEHVFYPSSLCMLMA